MFLRLVPSKYYPAIIRHLQKASLVCSSEYSKLDHPGMDVVMYRGIRRDSCKREPYTIEWLERYLRPGQVLYDIGANVGAYSLVAAKRFGGEVKVYAFEPAFQNFPVLVRNIQVNNCTGVILPISIPLSGGEGLLEFNYSSLDTGSALHAIGEPIDYRGNYFQPVFKQIMFSTTVDSLVYKYGLELPHHIKLDVDGLEFDILKGANKALQSAKCDSVLVEDAGRFDTNRLYEYMMQCGFFISEKYEHPNDAFYHIFKKN